MSAVDAIRLFNDSNPAQNLKLDQLSDLCVCWIKLAKMNRECLRFQIAHRLLNELYFELKLRKELEPIESLPEGEKRRIWKEAKGLHEEKKRQLMIARSIYLIEVL